MQITIAELAAALEVPLPERLCGDMVLSGISTDTRTLSEQQAFVALRGEKYDAHQFAAQALQQGAALAIVSRHLPELGERQLVVADTLQALGKVASWWRRRLPVRVAAVTGSAGKTTTKDFLAAICREAGPTVATLGNQNNEIGVPLTLLTLDETAQFCVVEFGMRGPGQIRALAEMVRPDVGIITNIGEAHIGLLGSREAIAQSKAELLPLLPKDGAAILPADDFFYPLLRGMCDCPVLSFGFTECAQVRVEQVLFESLEGLEAQVNLNGEVANLYVPLPGQHNLLNALGAAAAALALGCTPGQICEGIRSYQGMEMRGQIVDGPSGAMLINDAYNANPSSMAVALEMLSRAPGRKILVFGDMLELGEQGPQAHAKVGQQAAAAGVSLLFSVGELAALAAETAKQAGVEVRIANSPEEAAEALGPRLRAGDTVLIKGSRAMELERTVEQLLNAE